MLELDGFLLRREVERRRARLQRRGQVRDQHLRRNRIERCAQPAHDVARPVLLACGARQDRRPCTAQARRDRQIQTTVRRSQADHLRCVADLRRVRIRCRDAVDQARTGQRHRLSHHVTDVDDLTARRHRQVRCLNRRRDVAYRRRRVDHAAYARISIPIQRRTFRSTPAAPHVVTLVRLEHARLLHPLRVPIAIERLRAVDHRTADVDRRVKPRRDQASDVRQRPGVDRQIVPRTDDR